MDPTMGSMMENVPAAMREEKHWIFWRPVPDRNDPTKINKVPIDPFTSQPFEKDSGYQTDPARWTSFDRMNGQPKGFVLVPPWIGVDLDDCFVDGKVAPWAIEIVRALGTYAEISPSGTGIKIFMQGTRPEGAENVKTCAAWNFEIYSEKRYFTVTGNKLPEAPSAIKDCTAQIQKITEIVWGDDLLSLCRVRHLILRETRDNVHIRCPWESEHTHGHGEKDAGLQIKDEKVVGFHCFHGHCQERHLRDLEKWFEIKRDLIFNPGDPLPIAREFVARHHTVDGTLALRHQSSVFLGYTPEAGAYLERDEPSVRAELYRFLEPAQRWIVIDGERKLVPFQPARAKVENTLDALRAVCNLPETIKAPCWLAHDPGFNAIDIMACPNGLLYVPKLLLLPSSPQFFTRNAVEFPYDPDATNIPEWLTFLNSIWGQDEGSINTLQEIFGYSLTPDTKFQKIFMIVGPRRSGKGTIGRILSRVVGERNVCSPTLAAFGRDFGKHVLIGKSLAIISDARIGYRTDTSSVAETLLAVSGEDGQTVPRKFLPDWNGKLSTRFVLLTNELPNIPDVSGALAGRFIVLALEQTFYGKEDLGLHEKLVPELPGILNWALEGRVRLYERGYFEQPKSAEDLMQEFVDLGSPVATFLRACTVVEAGAQVSTKNLFDSWSMWCADNGRDKPGTAQNFGRNVRAVFPWITIKQTGGRGEQERCWMGLKLDEPDVKFPGIQ